VIERLLVRVRDRRIDLTDLPVEICPRATTTVETPRIASRVDVLYERLVVDRESFWTVVYEPFMERDLTRDDLRALVAKGLDETRGSYVMLVRLFNLEAGEYKRFLNFLHKHGCHLPVARFRRADIRRPLRASA
jgi:hypothetical protein